MLTAAATGLTVSGLRLIRVITLIKEIVWQVQDVFHPDTAIRYLQVGESRLSEEQVNLNTPTAILPLA